MSVTQHYRCDYQHCEREQDEIAPSALPVGWVRVEQGLGYYGGGTAAIPKEVDLLIAGRTFCSVAHLAAWVAVANMPPPPPVLAPRDPGKPGASP